MALRAQNSTISWLGAEGLRITSNIDADRRITCDLTSNSVGGQVTPPT